MRTLLLVFVFLSSITIYSQTNKKDSIFILINKKDTQLKMDISKDSLRSSFSILKYRFRTKSLQNKYLERIKKTFEIQSEFYLNYVGFKKPIKKHQNSIHKIYSIEEISRNNLNSGSKTKYFFIEKIKCNYYKTYEVSLRFEE